MENMQVEFSFKGKAKWRQLWSFLTIGKVYTYLTEDNILSIWRQYAEHKNR